MDCTATAASSIFTANWMPKICSTVVIDKNIHETDESWLRWFANEIKAFDSQ